VNITNCLIIGDTNTISTASTNRVGIYSSASNNDSVTISNNRFIGGSYAMYLNGISSTNRQNGLVVINNIIDRAVHYGIRMANQNRAIVSGNTITLTSTYTSTTDN